MSSADIIDLATFRNRRFAPPRSTHASLSRETRRRLTAFQLAARHGEEAIAGVCRRTWRAIIIGGLFTGLFAMGLMVAGAAALLAWSRA